MDLVNQHEIPFDLRCQQADHILIMPLMNVNILADMQYHLR